MQLPEAAVSRVPRHVPFMHVTAALSPPLPLSPERALEPHDVSQQEGASLDSGLRHGVLLCAAWMRSAIR